MDDSTPGPTLLQEALAAAARGWALMPLTGMVPQMLGWETAPAATTDRIRAWVADGYNLGVRTGAASGVIVLDEDVAAGGALAEVWAGLSIPEPLTPAVRTGRGGRHLYFRAPADPPRNSANLLAPNVAVLGEGGWVPIAGSIHPTTRTLYAWMPGLTPDDIPLAELPAPLLERLRATEAPPPKELAPPSSATAAPRRRGKKGDDQDRVDVLPSNPEAERALLGACLLDGTHVAVLHGTIHQGHFYNSRHGRIWATMVGLHEAGKHIDMVTVVGDLRARKALEDAGGPAYIAALPDGLPKISAASIQAYADQVLESARQRALATAAAAMQEATLAGDQPAARAAMERLQSIEDGKLDRTGVEVLLPGPHQDSADVYCEVGNDDFTDTVLRALPPGAMYRRATEPGELVTDDGRLRFRSMGKHRMRIVVDEHLRLVKWTKRGSDSVPVKVYCPCQSDPSAVVLAGAALSTHVRDLRMITNYPVFLGSNFDLAKPGWNEGHGVYYDEPQELAGLDTQVPVRDIESRLDDLVVDFPWKQDHVGGFGGSASKHNFFGLLLTPLLRFAVGGNAPLHMILSPIPRAGKTKLAEEILGGLVLGRPTPVLQFAGQDEERDKRIMSILRRGDTIVHLDNIRDFLDSAALASLLTSSTYSGRLLNTNEVPEYPNFLTIVASGNNIRATQEIVKRTVPISLAPDREDPENRADFRHPNLRQYVHENRRVILEALISMVVRWRDGDRMAGTRPKGGFERWAEVVGGVLATNGFGKWRSNEQAYARAADPETEDLKAWVDAVRDKYHTERVRAAELFKIAEDLGLFPHTHKAPSAQGRLMSFSKTVLSRYVDSPIGRHYLRRAGSGSASEYFLEDNPE